MTFDPTGWNGQVVLQPSSVLQRPWHCRNGDSALAPLCSARFGGTLVNIVRLVTGQGDRTVIGRENYMVYNKMPECGLVWVRHWDKKVVIAGCVKEDKWYSPRRHLIKADHDNHRHYWCALTCGEQILRQSVCVCFQRNFCTVQCD